MLLTRGRKVEGSLLDLFGSRVRTTIVTELIYTMGYNGVFTEPQQTSAALVFICRCCLAQPRSAVLLPNNHLKL